MFEYAETYLQSLNWGLVFTMVILGHLVSRRSATVSKLLAGRKPPKLVAFWYDRVPNSIKVAIIGLIYCAFWYINQVHNIPSGKHVAEVRGPALEAIVHSYVFAYAFHAIMLKRLLAKLDNSAASVMSKKSHDDPSQ